MKKWIWLAAILSGSAAMADYPSVQDGFVVLRTASATNVFYDCDFPTGNPDFTNTVTYIYEGENLFLGGEAKTPRGSCDSSEAAVDVCTMYYRVDGGPTNALNLPRIFAGSPDQWQQATATGMVEIGRAWSVGLHTVDVYFVGVDVNFCQGGGINGRLPATGAFEAIIDVRPGAADVLACDDAAQRAYQNGWTNGANGGYGFGPWTTLVSVVGDGDAAGFFRAVNPPNTDLNNSASRGFAWGLYANEGGSSNGQEDPQIAGAFRALPADLQVGQTFAIDFEHGGILSGSLSADFPPRIGGWVGFSLRSDMPPLQFDPDPISPFAGIQNAQLMVGFRGGDSNYTVWDTQSPSGRDTGLPYTDGGVRAEVTRTGVDTFSLRLSSLSPGGPSVTLTGITSGGALSVVGVYDRNAQQNDVFFNNMWVLDAPQASRSAADDAADPAYLAGWTNAGNGGFGFQSWSIGAVPGAGSAGYFLATNPPNSDLNGIASLGRAWGMYANDNPGGGVQAVTAYRYFSQPMRAGQTFGMSMEHGGISPINGRVEIMMLVQPRLGNVEGLGAGFRAYGGNSAYSGTDNLPSSYSEGPYTDGGVRYDFKLMSTNEPSVYALTIDTRGPNGGIYRVCGEIEKAPIGMRFQIMDVEMNDVFLNRLYLTAVGPDVDGDQMPDGWEQENGLNVGANDAYSDNDGDGYFNIEEFVAGTQPTNNASLFRATGFTVGSPAVVTVNSLTGRLYTLEQTTNLPAGNWSSVTGQVDVAGTGALLSITNNPVSPELFQRLRVRMAP